MNSEEEREWYNLILKRNLQTVKALSTQPAGPGTSIHEEDKSDACQEIHEWKLAEEETAHEEVRAMKNIRYQAVHDLKCLSLVT